MYNGTLRVSWYFNHSSGVLGSSKLRKGELGLIIEIIKGGAETVRSHCNKGYIGVLTSGS